MAAFHLALAKFWYKMIKQERLLIHQDLETNDAFAASREGSRSVLECLGLKASTKVFVIFWSTVTAARMLWEHDQTHFDDAKYVDLRFAVVGGDVKRPITALRALPHVSYLKPELETLLALVQNALVLQREINEDTELTTFLTALVDQVSDLLSVLEIYR